MRFFHGTSVRAWIGIIKSGSMDSKKANDSRVSALYSKYKGNYLTSNRAIAEMYAKKVGSGVILEIEFDPNAPGRVNNFKEQIANGKDYFVEETPLEVDGANCSIECKDPTKTKAKIRAEFNINNKNEVHMENEVNLDRAWKKLEESFNLTPTRPGDKKPIEVGNKPNQLPVDKALQINKQADKMKQTNPDWNPAQDSMFEGGIDLSVYEFGDQIMASADAQGLTLDQNQINVANDRIVSALQGEGMSNPHNLEAIIDDAVADAAYQGGQHSDGVGGGIMESIEISLKLLKKLKK